MFMVMNPSLETQPSIRRLLEHYPDMPSFLVFESPFQLLIAVILSAQCTDAMVNKVSQVLFARYPDPQALAAASIEDLERIVHPTGFFRAKARNIQRCAQSLVDLHQGVVPDSMTALTKLAGVGRKTASVILGQVYANPAIIVDTHFGRVVRRLGLTRAKDAVKVEKELAQLVNPENHYHFSMVANLHGRVLCHARKPKCGECFLLDLCPEGKSVSG
jgi:endonuclease-3